MKKLFITGLFLITAGIFSGCKDSDSTVQPPATNKSIDQLTVSATFNFETSKEVTVSVKVQTPLFEAMPGVPVKLYKGAPSSGGAYMETLLSDGSGMINTKIVLPGYADSIWLVTEFIGLPSEIAVPVVGKTVDYSYNIALPSSLAKEGTTTETQYKTLGSWTSLGVPRYLMPTRDNITTSLLNNINTSLPETKAVTSHHPQYLQNVETNVLIKDTCEVYVTFVHEGAGYRNVFGYYTFNKNNPPTKISDIENSMTLIFPNASYAGSGGGLYSGDKVKIGNFGPNTSIGWFVLSDGFKSSTSITDGNWRFFSHPALNPESNTSLRQHNVSLYDDANDRYIVGFEDIKRDVSGCDNDFNDVLFYVTANPFTAIISNNVAPLDSAADADKDGVTDIFDEYKTDPLRAFNNYSPAKNIYGTLAFEDLWPARGDYDFNDLVVDYNFNTVTNAQNKVVEMFVDLKIRAIGGSYVNAFALHLPVSATAISSVTGQKLTEGYINLNANGTESGNSKASIVAFDNPFKIMSASGATINTTPGLPYFEPKTVNLKISFASPVDKTVLGTAPFNPFIIVNKVRGKEIHLKGSEPTELADRTLFGKDDDRSLASPGGYYKSDKNLPWAVSFTESFDYPVEKTKVTSSYNYFAPWAESSALQYKDWYLNKSGYRVPANIYNR